MDSGKEVSGEDWLYLGSWPLEFWPHSSEYIDKTNWNLHVTGLFESLY